MQTLAVAGVGSSALGSAAFASGSRRLYYEVEFHTKGGMKKKIYIDPVSGNQRSAVQR
jgi:hypothetical protein